MQTYVFQAALWCEDCGLAIRHRLLAAHQGPRHPDDESSYDSDRFPKGPYPDGGGESDVVEHCAGMGDCLNRQLVGTLRDGRPWYVGVWLENELTTEGLKQLAAELRTRPTNPVIQQHGAWYADQLQAAGLGAALRPQLRRLIKPQSHFAQRRQAAVGQHRRHRAR